MLFQSKHKYKNDNSFFIPISRILIRIFMKIKGAGIYPEGHFFAFVMTNAMLAILRLKEWQAITSNANISRAYVISKQI